MRYAVVLLASIVLLLSIADAVSQEPLAEAREPLAAATRDAQHLAECMKTLDTDCVVSFSDRSYKLLGWNYDFAAFAAAQANFFEVMRRNRYEFTRFETSAPRDLFTDGGRVYAFVPYECTLNLSGQSDTTRAYFIALSVDGGDTWTFVDGRGLTPEQVRRIIPSSDGQPLPLTHLTGLYRLTQSTEAGPGG
jgi:hypothetical protein